MRKLLYSFVSILGLMMINSCGQTDDRESQVHEYLQQKITSESQGAIKLDNFKKTNGYDQDIGGMKFYILELQAEISTQQEIWKGGNAFVGYWGNFGVMTKQPDHMEEMMMASSSQHFNIGTKIRLTGDCKLQKTEQGWRVSNLNIRASQILNEDSKKIDPQELTNQSNLLINTNWITLKAQLQRRTDLYSSVIKTVEAYTNFEKSTLQAVAEAMAKVTSINVDINDSKSLEAYQNAQANLQGSFSRLVASFEAYPDLKTTQAFRDFEAQIEGTENRINVTKKEYNDLCKKYGRNDILFGSE